MRFAQLKQRSVNSVIPAWRAGIQVDMDVSGRVLANLDTGYHAGMTHSGFSYFVCELKLMNHFIDQPAGKK